MLMGYALLANFGTGGTFSSLTVFFIIGGFATIGSVAAYIMGFRPFKWFDGQFNLQDIIYIGIGFVGLFISVYLLTAYIAGNVGILIGLFSGGIVLAIALIRSENAMVPIIAHGIYDSLVLMIANGVFGSIAVDPATLGVSAFTFGSITPQDAVNQTIIQFIGPAFSEEMLKISTALGIGIMFNTKNKWVMMIIAVLAWAGLHSVISYPVNINLASITPH